MARARGWGPERVRQILAQNQHGRLLGIFGEPRVNGLLLKLTIGRLFGRPAAVAADGI